MTTVDREIRQMKKAASCVKNNIHPEEVPRFTFLSFSASEKQNLGKAFHLNPKNLCLPSVGYAALTSLFSCEH